MLGFGGLEQAKPVWKDLMTCLEMQLHIEAIVCEGQIVAVRYTERGTATKSFRGQPATGKSYELVAMEWFELKGDRIARRCGARDSASMARQLGWSERLFVRATKQGETPSEIHPKLTAAPDSTP